MVNAVAGKDQKRALDLYYELLALKEPPMRILFLMTREYRLLFHVKGLMVNGYGKKEIASKAGSIRLLREGIWMRRNDMNSES